jgi:hypothetical protein
MKRSMRLPKTINGHFMARRLDLASERRNLVTDIMKLGGADELDSLHSELCGFGDSLEDALKTLSIPRLRRIHARAVSGTMEIPIVYDF